MSIQKIRPDLPPPTTTPQCSSSVQESKFWHIRDGYMARRTAQCEERGWDPHRCLRHSSYLIDGKPYCKLHAGAIALERVATKLEDPDAKGP